MADMQRDPVQTSIMLTEALLQKKLEPLMQRYQQEEEVRRDNSMRENIAKLAESDPRVLQQNHFDLINQILAEEPEMMRLKNPHKAAWNEAKERLRLGDVKAQPSTPTPTLGRGAPPSVSTLPGSTSNQSLYQQVASTNPYTDEGKMIEEKLREATKNLWQ
jgi:hypothetical protein